MAAAGPLPLVPYRVLDLTERLGSQSNSTVRAPARASSVASRIAVVDFPAPPFGEAMTITGMASPLSGVRVNRI